MLPGKPVYEVRTLRGQEAARMHLWSVEAADGVFGVGYLEYPTVDRNALAGIRDALVNNIQGRLLHEHAFALDGLTGSEFEAFDGARLLTVRLLPRGSRVYQIAVLTEKGAISTADVDLFLSSFTFLEKSPRDQLFSPEGRRKHDEKRK